MRVSKTGEEIVFWGRGKTIIILYNLLYELNLIKLIRNKFVASVDRRMSECEMDDDGDDDNDYL